MDDAKYFEVPNLHEIDACQTCHKTSEHMLEDVNYWSEEGCPECETLADMLTDYVPDLKGD